MNAYTMGERYGDIAGSAYKQGTAREQCRRPAGRARRVACREDRPRRCGKGGRQVLIADERLSVLLQVSDGALVEFFEKQATAGRYITLGVMVRSKRTSRTDSISARGGYFPGWMPTRFPGGDGDASRDRRQARVLHGERAHAPADVVYPREGGTRFERLRDGADIRD